MIAYRWGKGWQAGFDYDISLGISPIKTFGAFMDLEYLRRFGKEEILSYSKLLKEYV